MQKNKPTKETTEDLTIKLINNMGKSSKVSATELVNKSPEAAAAISKLHKPAINRGSFDDPNQALNLFTSGSLNHMVQRTRDRIRDNQNIMRMFPDTEMVIQIVIAAMLSPKDMLGTTFIYRTIRSIFDSELTNTLVSKYEEYMEQNYQVKSKAYTKLRNIIAEQGAHINLILPENILDEQINGRPSLSMESASYYSPIFKDFEKRKPVSLGILGTPSRTSLITNTKKKMGRNKVEVETTTFAFESAILNMDQVKQLSSSDTEEQLIVGLENNKLQQEKLVEFSDNFTILKFPKVLERKRQLEMKNIISSVCKRSYGNESAAKKMSGSAFTDIIFKAPQQQSNQIEILPTRLNAYRKSVGKPLVMDVSPVACQPVYMPGEPTKHIGYIFVVDADGHFVTDTPRDDNGLNGISGAISGVSGNADKSTSSVLLDRARRSLIGLNKEPSISNISNVAQAIVDKDIKDRFKNGFYGTEVEIGGNDTIYRTMIARLWENKMTRLVFVPAELVAYYALKYFDNGIGKSYLDDLSLLASVRGIVLMSKVYAHTTNAIQQTNVTVSFDPEDPDPYKTADEVQFELARMRQIFVPLGLNAPADHVDWLQRAGININFENHPDFPQTKITYENKSAQKELPDNDFDDMLRKQFYMGFSTSPEMVDNGFSGNFATTDVLNNVMFSRRTAMMGEIYSQKETDFHRKLAVVDPVLREELISLMRDNIASIEKNIDPEDKDLFDKDKDGYLNDLYDLFIESVVVELPKPDVKSLESQAAAFDAQADAIDKALDLMYFNSDLLSSDISGDIANYASQLKAIAKAAKLREWCHENGYMTELSDLIMNDEEGNAFNFTDNQKSFLEALSRTTVELIAKMKASKDAAMKDLERLNNGDASSAEGSEPTEGGETSDDGGEGSGEGSGEGESAGKEGGDGMMTDEDLGL